MQRGNGELGIIAGLAALCATFWKLGLWLGLSAGVTGCSTYGGELRLGWVPLNAIEQTQSLKQENIKEARR